MEESEIRRRIEEMVTMIITRVTIGIESLELNGIKIGTGVLIINYIGTKTEVSMKDIIGYLDVPASTATRRIDKLADFGLVERETDPEDRRLVTIKLTEKGQKMYHKFVQSRMKGMEALEGSLSKAESQIFFKSIEKLMAYDKKIEDFF